MSKTFEGKDKPVDKGKKNDKPKGGGGEVRRRPVHGARLLGTFIDNKMKEALRKHNHPRKNHNNQKGHGRERDREDSEYSVKLTKKERALIRGKTKLGDGRSGKVVRDGNKALKVFCDENAPGISERCIRELSILLPFKGLPGTLPILSYTISPQVTISMPLFSGDIHNRDVDVMELMRCLLSTVRFLHINRIAHLDIRHPNILFLKDKVSGKETYTLCDYDGATRFTNTQKVDVKLQVDDFQAPESAPCDPFKLDVWCIGVTLLQSLGYADYYYRSSKDPIAALWRQVFPRTGPPRYRKIHEYLQLVEEKNVFGDTCLCRLLRACLVENPNERADIFTVCEIAGVSADDGFTRAAYDKSFVPMNTREAWACSTSAIVTPSMYLTLITWLLTLSTDRGLHVAVWALATDILDRYLAKPSSCIDKSQFQAIGVVCLNLSAKIFDELISMKRCAYFCKNIYSINELCDHELRICHTLGFYLWENEALEWLDFCSSIGTSEIEKVLARLLVIEKTQKQGGDLHEALFSSRYVPGCPYEDLAALFTRIIHESYSPEKIKTPERLRDGYESETAVARRTPLPASPVSFDQ